jgi:uncharacterized SAM-binding protein YcdF (DUF218 family)
LTAPLLLDWRSCPAAPLAWIGVRELLLTVLFTPALLLPVLGLAGGILAGVLRLPRVQALVLTLLLPMVASVLYTPLATDVLTGWLQAQVPPPSPTNALSPVVVLVGRGPAIAAATTSAAAPLMGEGLARAVYVSGDVPATAQLLLGKGVAPERVAGDSCARTTWENASLTATWLDRHHPGATVLLITDPWQLPRATRAFQRQGLRVNPRPADPPLPPADRNRLALREAAATLLYRVQGRI